MSILGSMRPSVFLMFFEILAKVFDKFNNFYENRDQLNK